MHDDRISGHSVLTPEEMLAFDALAGLFDASLTDEQQVTVAAGDAADVAAGAVIRESKTLDAATTKAAKTAYQDTYHQTHQTLAMAAYEQDRLTNITPGPDDALPDEDDDEPEARVVSLADRKVRKEQGRNKPTSHSSELAA